MYLRLRMTYRRRIVVYRWRRVMVDRGRRIMLHRCGIMSHWRMIYRWRMRGRRSHIMNRRIIRSVGGRRTRKIGCRIRRMISRRPRYRNIRRPPVIHRRKLASIDTCIMLVR